MPNRLIGKVALITGAARGMGAAEARLFASEGANVLLADILDEEGRRLANEINRSHPCRVLYLHLDVTKAADWRNAIATAEQTFGHLNILVNNAGIYSAIGIEATTEDDWHRIIDINQKGVWLGIKSATPALRRAGSGSIVNISSIFGIVGSPGSSAYHATKGAIRILSKAAAAELAPSNIRVNSVYPGIIDTPMVDALSPQARQAVAAACCLKREGRPEEVAFGVLFLASDEASYITGAELIIDGGYTAL